jgi:hypothetical protein
MNDIDARTCEVCKTNFDWNDEFAGCLDLGGLLDFANNNQINKWQEQNENIDLQSYFCRECANKTIKAIEENEVA